MTSPDEIAVAIRTALSTIPWVLTNMPGRIAFHVDAPFNEQINLAEVKVPTGGALIMQVGIAPGRIGTSEMHAHQFDILIRPPIGSNGFETIKELLNGTPAGSPVRLMNMNIHPHCDLMDLPVAVRRTDADGLDYFVLTMVLRESGENY